jgi:hypothetical protein
MDFLRDNIKKMGDDYAKLASDVEVKLLFPTVLYQTNLELKKKEIDAIKAESYERNGQNNGWVTKRTDLHLKYKSLMSTIDKHVEIYCKEVLQMVDNDLSCCISWVNKLSKGDAAPRHAHTYSMVSGVLYLDVPENSGDIVFYAPNMMFGNFFRITTAKENDFNSGLNVSKVINIKTGLLLLFPSVLEHSVIPNESNKDRYSLAFDYTCVGNFNAISIAPVYRKLKDELFE